MWNYPKKSSAGGIRLAEKQILLTYAKYLTKSNQNSIITREETFLEDMLLTQS